MDKIALLTCSFGVLLLGVTVLIAILAVMYPPPDEKPWGWSFSAFGDVEDRCKPDLFPHACFFVRKEG